MGAAAIRRAVVSGAVLLRTGAASMAMGGATCGAIAERAAAQSPSGRRRLGHEASGGPSWAPQTPLRAFFDIERAGSERQSPLMKLGFYNQSVQ